MLTIKNQAGMRLALFLATASLVFAAGCKPPGARALLAGKSLYEKGKFAPAIEQFQKATTLLPSNALAWNYLALASHAAGQPNDAATAYQKALALNPNLVEAHYSYGCLLLEQNNPAAAKNELTAYTLSRPNDVNGWLRLATAQWRNREPLAAEKSFTEVLRLDDKNPEAVNGLGLVQLYRNRPREAAAYFTAALKQQSDYPPARLNLAVVQQQYLNSPQSALRNYREYLTLKPAPANADAIAAIADNLEQALKPPPPVVKPAVIAQPPKPTPTVATDNTTVVIHPTPPPAPRPVPIIKPEPKPVAPPEAATVTSNPPPVKAAPPVVELPILPLVTNPNPPVIVAPAPPIAIAIVSNVPVRVVAAPDNPPPKPPPAPKTIAQYTYRTLAKPKPGKRADADAAFALGLEAQQEKRLPDALAAFRVATKADPSYFKAHYNLAWTAYALKDWATALDAYETALTIEPESPDARYNFALTLKQANYPLDAANELERLLVKRPDDAAAQLLLANLYSQQLNSPRLARPHYLRVLEIQPTHPQATQIRYWLTENPP